MIPLTAPGWSVGVGSILVLGLGRLLGMPELYVIGACLLVLTVGALGFTTLSRLRLRVGRELRPHRVHVGDACHIELEITNLGPRRTRVLRLRDVVERTTGAQVLVAPIEPDGRSRVSYEVPTHQRGRIAIGPLTVELTDPFGLSRVSTTAAGRAMVVVLPRIEPLRAPPRSGPGDPSGARASGLRSSGSDFHSLRPFVAGDDLRRVHWPTTARRDALTVQQHQHHEQGRTTVVLDTELPETGPPTFERAVSVAASLLAAAADRGDELRLVTTDGDDSTFLAAAEGLPALLEHLATIEGQDQARALVDRALADEHTDSAVIVVTTAGSGYRPPPPAITIAVAPSVDGSGPQPTAHAVTVGADEPLTAAWSAVVAAHEAVLT